MNRDLRGLLAPLVAIVVFGVVFVQTYGALRSSGAWGASTHRRAAIVVPDDPFGGVNALLLRAQPALDAGMLRDPFATGAAPAPVAQVTGPVKPRPVPPPPAPERPVLTAIVFDSDPRALVRWKGREWTVRKGGLFDEFQVLDITREQVSLSRGSETLVLQRKPQGD